MPELCYLDGRTLPMADASVSPEDRGYNFGDGVYEVIRVYRGVPFALDLHLERLADSAGAIGIRLPRSLDAYRAVIHELVARAGHDEAAIYIQLTRGAEPRAHVFSETIRPVDFAYVRPLADKAAVRAKGQHVLTAEDDRWSRCHIKSLNLLPNILAKNEAARRGALEAMFVMPESRVVTEGSASNLFAVKDGAIHTHPIAGGKVLPGVTRQVMLELARRAGIEVIEERRTLEFFLAADEVLLSSTTLEIVPIGRIDETVIGDGEPGPMQRRLQHLFEVKVAAECGVAAAEAETLVDEMAVGGSGA
jgi:D-alanine transaminase